MEEKEFSQKSELAALRDRVSALEHELKIVRDILGRCIVTTVAGSHATLGLSIELTHMLKNLKYSPPTERLLKQLEEQTEALTRAVQEADSAR